jgi:large subunit ribosomal protein L34
MPKRTYKPSKVRRARKFGFRSRAKSKSGKKVLKARRLKGRKSLSL